MGNSSPTAPAAKMKRPNVPASMCCSRRIGSSVPSAVVVNAIDTGTKARTKPRYSSPPTIRTAATALITQPIRACRPAFSRSSAGSNSYPASRNRNPNPRPATS